MADNPTEEAPPTAPAEEVAAPAEEAAAPAVEAAAPAVEAAGPAGETTAPAVEAAVPEEAPLPEATVEIPVENVERPPTDAEAAADGAEQPAELGGEGNVPRVEGEDVELKAKGPVTAEQRKRQKLEKIKKMLELEKAATLNALKAAEVENKVKAKKAKVVEEEASDESYQSLVSEEGEQSSDEFKDLKAALNEYDDIEKPAPEGSDAEEDADEEESVSSEETPLPRLPESLKGMFLREFESLPSIGDISLDISYVEPEPEADAHKDITETQESDEGHFVDGGEVGEGESEDSASGQDTATAADAVAGDEEESESVSSMMDELPEELAAHEKRVVITENVEEDTMAMFAVAVEANAYVGPDIVIPVEEPFWYRLTSEFVEKLIATVVENSEKAAYSLLRLDKIKMLMGLTSGVEELYYEKFQTSTLNNIVCEYYRRNGKYANFIALSPEDAAKERERFHRALNLVDNLRERVKLMKINYGTTTNMAMIALSSLTVLSFNEEQRLEDLMRRTLIRRDMERLRRALDNDLRRMQDLRNQISEKRYELNLNLHNLAFVDHKVTKFERITDTLTISQMLCTNESVIHLGKQLEEKSKDVSVMQSNYKKSMIEETCIREKRDMISYSLEKAKIKYLEGIERRNFLRRELTRLQSEHASLKAQRARLEVKGGLLFKVVLMHDYDKCMEDVLEKRESVKKLKATIADINKRIYALGNDMRRSTISVRHY